MDEQIRLETATTHINGQGMCPALRDAWEKALEAPVGTMISASGEI